MMTQLPLLTIRKQPLQPEPKIRSSVIREYVRQNLRDFARRQAERERKRAEYIKHAKPRTKKGKIDMVTIKVTYRAVFEQLRCGTVLCGYGFKVPGPFPVELFHRGRQGWTVREIASPQQRVYAKLPTYTTIDKATADLPNYFKNQIGTWQIWGIPPADPAYQNEDRATAPEMLGPEQICCIGEEGKFGYYQAKDRTHIIHAPYPDGERVPPAACGARKLDSKHFVSTKANVRPSCPQCAAIWEKEYRDK